MDLRLFDDLENLISFREGGDLLQTCVEATGCRHFGLLLGQQPTLSALGILGQLMRHSPTVRDALRAGVMHLGIHDRGAVALSLEIDASRSALGYVLLSPHPRGAEQILDMATAKLYVLLREMCGPAWKPRWIQLSHGRSEDVSPLREFFGTEPRFDAEVSAVVFDSRWLDHRIAGADPAAHAAATAAVAALESGELDVLSARVRRALHAFVLGGSALSTSVARLFQVSERTLRRRLDEEGASIRQLATEARKDLAYHLLKDTGLSVARIAAVLNYADATVFSRAFRAWAGMSPARWRELNAPAA